MTGDVRMVISPTGCLYHIPQTLLQLSEVLGRLGFKGQYLTGDRVAKAEQSGVQRLSLQSLRTGCDTSITRSFAVHRITDNRKAGIGKVDANLVGPPGLQSTPHKRSPVVIGLHGRILSHSPLATRDARRKAFPVDGVTPKQRVIVSLCGLGWRSHQRQIFTRERLVGERLR